MRNGATSKMAKLKTNKRGGIIGTILSFAVAFTIAAAIFAGLIYFLIFMTDVQIGDNPFHDVCVEQGHIAHIISWRHTGDDDLIACITQQGDVKFINTSEVLG